MNEMQVAEALLRAILELIESWVSKKVSGRPAKNAAHNTPKGEREALLPPP